MFVCSPEYILDIELVEMQQLLVFHQAISKHAIKFRRSDKSDAKKQGKSLG